MKKSWNQFRETGLFLFVNQFLHIFGWAIVIDLGEDDEVKDVYPARVTCRGFSEESTDRAYKRISKFMLENAQELNDEIK